MLSFYAFNSFSFDWNSGFVSFKELIEAFNFFFRSNSDFFFRISEDLVL